MQSQKTTSGWPHHVSVQTRAMSTFVLWCSDFSNWALLSPRCRCPTQCWWTQQAELVELPKIPVPTWGLLTARGSLLGHGTCIWASKPLWSKRSSLRTATGINLFLFFWNIQSKVLFQMRFPNKPQSPTLAFMPAHCPLPSKPLLPESAAGAKSLHLHVWEMGQKKGKIQPSVEASWESPLRWDPRALPGSLWLCSGAVRHEGGAWWLLFLLASRSHSSRRQHRGSCGMRERLPAEPILISFPLPRLAGATAHPVPFQGDSRGNQRTPHNCDCAGGGGWKKEKTTNFFHQVFSFREEKSIYSEISGKYLVRSLGSSPPFPINAADRELFADWHMYHLSC